MKTILGILALIAVSIICLLVLFASIVCNWRGKEKGVYVYYGSRGYGKSYYEQQKNKKNRSGKNDR